MMIENTVSMSDFERQGQFAKANAFYPLLDAVGAHLAQRGTLKNVRLAWHCHLTTLTAISAKALAAAGCQAALSECNPATSDEAAIQYMRSLGFKVFTGPSSRQQVLMDGVDVISDTGFDLIGYWLSLTDRGSIHGACEITTSGITRLRATESLAIPIININDGEIKSLVENFHGVGDGVIDAIKVLTGRSLQGERAVVAGYGRVGAGVAHYLRLTGLQVTVVEPDPVRQLVAHFDGFPVAALRSAIKDASLLVTATGKKGLLSLSDWSHAGDGMLAINVGHWREELNLDELQKASMWRNQISPHVEEFTIEAHDGKPLRVRVATNGDPSNVALLTGSIEPTLLHLAVELLSVEYLVTHGNQLKPGELRVPREVESKAAELALRISMADKSFDPLG